MDGKYPSKQLSKSNVKGNAYLEELLPKVKQSLERLSSLDNIDLLNTDYYNDMVAMNLHIFCNSSDKNSDVCQYICDSGLVPMLLHALTAVSYNDKKEYYVEAILGILHNVLQHIYDGQLLMRESDGVRILQLFFKSEQDIIRVLSLFGLSYIIDETESEMLNSNSDILSFILDMFDNAMKLSDHRYKGFHITEILRALSNLSLSDVNKELLVQNGILPLYVRLLQEKSNPFSEEDIHLVINGLWALSFCDKNKGPIEKEPGCLDALHRAIEHDNEDIRKAGQGTMWQLQSSKVNIPCSPDKTTKPHIMISYQWDAQPVMLKIKEKLELAGYKVWIDVECMSGSTLEAMAFAVEMSALVLIGVSKRYKDSQNCRAECEYAFKCRKDIIPLIVQKGYEPDGWLGMVMGAKLYFDFSSSSNVDAQITRLIKEIGTRGLKLDEDESNLNVAKRLSNTNING